MLGVAFTFVLLTSMIIGSVFFYRVSSSTMRHARVSRAHSEQLRLDMEDLARHNAKQMVREDFATADDITIDLSAETSTEPQAEASTRSAGEDVVIEISSDDELAEFGHTPDADTSEARLDTVTAPDSVQRSGRARQCRRAWRCGRAPGGAGSRRLER